MIRAHLLETETKEETREKTREKTKGGNVTRTRIKARGN